MSLQFKNIQECTDLEQSARLIELGFDVKTADMTIFEGLIENQPLIYKGNPQKHMNSVPSSMLNNLHPAWSIDALYQLLISKLEEK